MQETPSFDASTLDAPTSRRSFLRAGTAAAAGVTLLATTSSASGQSEYGGYLDDVGNYDGTVVDETGADRVTIEVGADGNGGPFAFEPPAVRVSPGTTVVWEWVAEMHNVVDEDGAFESELTNEVGFTFEQTFEEPGVRRYYCAPHKAIGMKGVVDVVEDSGGGAGGSSGDGSGGGAGGSNGDGGGGDAGEDAPGSSITSVGPVVPTVLALAFVIPAAAAALLNRRDGETDHRNDRR